jgi:hypothetical protein
MEDQRSRWERLHTDIGQWQVNCTRDPLTGIFVGIADIDQRCAVDQSQPGILGRNG